MFQICDNVRKGWKVVKDPAGRMGPYAHRGNQWVSFDDVATIKRKVSTYIDAYQNTNRTAKK